MILRVIKPRQFDSVVQLPASKSISNRALVMNELSAGASQMLTNLSDCDDTRAMEGALQLLSAERLTAPAADGSPAVINVGAAGTAMRFLTALLALAPGKHRLEGSERIHHRPIGVLVEALRALGAEIGYEGQPGFPPLCICGNRLRGGSLELAGDVSSQFISALLMIGPKLEEGLTLTLTGEIVSRPYIDMTLRMMRDYGAVAQWTGQRQITVEPKGYVPTAYRVEADWSAASYWYEMLLLWDGDDGVVTLQGLEEDSMQGDSAVKEMFARLSLQTEFYRQGEVSGVRLTRQGSVPESFEWDFTGTPDLAQTLVVACAMRGIAFRFTGLQSLRIKETDRIAALQAELAKLGVRVGVEGDSVMFWDGPQGQPEGDIGYLEPLAGTAIDTYEDHRMAMAFAPAAFVLGHIDIRNPEVVTKSYPGFWKQVASDN